MRAGLLSGEDQKRGDVVDPLDLPRKECIRSRMRELFFLLMVLLLLRFFFPLVAERTEQLLVAALNVTAAAVEEVASGTTSPEN